MTKTDMGATDTAQPAADIAWRHFWLANVVVETDRRPLVRAARPELRPRKRLPEPAPGEASPYAGDTARTAALRSSLYIVLHPRR